jgi:hypothetical protein
MIFLPCATPVMVIGVDVCVMSVLWRAGLRPGLLGVSDRRVLARFGPHVCRVCGYSLIGNVSGVCPECGVRREDRQGGVDERAIR